MEFIQSNFVNIYLTKQLTMYIKQNLQCFEEEKQVILHTYIDSLRDDENREVNKHGKPQKVYFAPLLKSFSLYNFHVF